MGGKSCVGWIIRSEVNLVAKPFRLLAKMFISRPVEVTGIASVGVKSLDIRKNTNNIGRLLGRF